MAASKKTAPQGIGKSKPGRPKKYPGGSVQVFFFLPKDHLQKAKDGIENYLKSFQKKDKFKQGELL